MNKDDKKFLYSSLLCFIPVLISLLFYKTLPAQIPTHWNINGEVDGYSSKIFALIVIPIILFIIDLVVKIVILNDPKKLGHTRKIKTFFKYFIPLLSLIILIFEILFAKNIFISSKYFNNILFTIIGIMFICLGLIMPSVKQNYTIGIKIPWTLNDEENWTKTHKFGGFIFLVGGIILILNNILIKGTLAEFILIFDIIVMCILPIIYSFVLYKRS